MFDIKIISKDWSMEQNENWSERSSSTCQKASIEAVVVGPPACHYMERHAHMFAQKEVDLLSKDREIK